MIVCVCNAVNERAIRGAIEEGHDSLDALEFELGVGSCCGRCTGTVCAILHEARCARRDVNHDARPAIALVRAEQMAATA